MILAWTATLAGTNPFGGIRNYILGQPPASSDLVSFCSKFGTRAKGDM
jgi:hypothetical protein